MNGSGRTFADTGIWRRRFADILLGGDPGELEAAASAAAAAEAGGADQQAAKEAGKAAARRFRSGRGGPGWAAPRGNGTERRPHAGPDTRFAEPPSAGGNWPGLLAPRLFALPARWGWQAAPVVATPAATPIAVPSRPVWAESPLPDSSALHGARSRAVSKLIRLIAFAVLAGAAAVAFQSRLLTASHQLDSSGRQLAQVAAWVIAGLLLLAVVRAASGVSRASRAIQAFEQPYKAMRASERQRHEKAVADWDAVVRRHQAESAELARITAQRANGPRWYPVPATSQPTRVDVFGGDPRRNGWASLLVTFGTSILAAGQHITVLDLTGQDVGGGLAAVAAAHGLATGRLDIGPGSPADLLDGVPRRAVAECLAQAVTGRTEGNDQRHERALTEDMLNRVLGSLDGDLGFDRLAAGVRVLLQGTGEELLSDTEIGALAAHIGDVDRGEWTTRQLRFLASRLDVLHTISPTAPRYPLWTDHTVTLITTPGGVDDRKELLDRLLVQTAQCAMSGDRRLRGYLVVAGADHLGAPALRVLSDHARRADVRLVLMIDQPQGDLEKSAGTGGAVCIMKMYNHRDAAIAAEFVGKGHKFVLNSVTRQTGQSFSDGGSDNFNASTGHSDGTNQGSGRKANGSSVSDTRGHAWAGTRTWQASDNISSSTASARVYEFIVDPQEILGMPETAFILVDNSGRGRRLAMTDGNPGISTLDGVSARPL